MFAINTEDVGYLTPKVFANESPELERSDNSGINQEQFDKTLKGFLLARTLSGLIIIFVLGPKVLAALETWATISERLRRSSTASLLTWVTFR